MSLEVIIPIATAAYSLIKDIFKAAEDTNDFLGGIEDSKKAYCGVKGFLRKIFGKKDKGLKKVELAEKADGVAKTKEEADKQKESAAIEEPKDNICIFSAETDKSGKVDNKNLNSIEQTLKDMPANKRADYMRSLEHGYIPLVNNDQNLA